MSKPAFSLEARLQRARLAAKAAWFVAVGAGAKALTRPEDDAPRVRTDAPRVSRATLRRAYMQAFVRDARDVAAGLYPPADGPPPTPAAAVARLADFLADAQAVDARRRRDGRVEARDEPESEAYPAYYRQNFHYQSGGWFTEESARRYEDQVETLFSGAGGPMRRRALALLAQAWRGRDHRGLRLMDVGCGSGAFLADLKATFPRALIAGVDLSPPYLAEARRRSGVQALAQAAAERLPFADSSLDAVTCVYLFHELPPRVRRAAAAEMARVLKPGGVLAFADSVQAVDEPELARMLAAFPAYFHEPYYGSYQDEDLVGLFAGAGLTLRATDKVFLTKALLLEK
jgi:ubiquinone/menaquinone biosynthesis C-methylase UbiE